MPAYRHEYAVGRVVRNSFGAWSGGSAEFVCWKIVAVTNELGFVTSLQHFVIINDTHFVLVTNCTPATPLTFTMIAPSGFTQEVRR